MIKHFLSAGLRYAGAALLLISFGGAPTLVTARADAPPTHPGDLQLRYSLDEYAHHIVSGGPPKDGIPAIDHPRFVDAAGADQFLRPDDIVFGVVWGVEARAYPQKILVWHEIANDRLGGVNVAVTYCPLTGTAIGYRRGATTLGVSGTLVNDNLVMYDRATDSRWPQIIGTAVSGSLKGQRLSDFRLIWTTWKRWRAAHPDTRVLSTDTGYQRDPYGDYRSRSGYYAPDAAPLFYTMHDDSRYAPKQVVIGARTRDGAIAFLKSAVPKRRVVTGRMADTAYVAVYDSRLDTAYVYRNPAKRAVVADGARYRLGGQTYAAESLPLEPVNGFDAMWFAWVAYFPGTQVYE